MISRGKITLEWDGGFVVFVNLKVLSKSCNMLLTLKLEMWPLLLLSAIMYLSGPRNAPGWLRSWDFIVMYRLRASYTLDI